MEDPAEEITLHPWEVTRHEEVAAGSPMGGKNPGNRRSSEKNRNLSLGDSERMHRRSDSKTDCCWMLRLGSWIGVALRFSVKLIHSHQQLFRSRPRFHSELTGLAPAYSAAVLLRMASHCSFLVSPEPPRFWTAIVVGGSGIPLCPKSPAGPTMASPFPLLLATAAAIDGERRSHTKENGIIVIFSGSETKSAGSNLLSEFCSLKLPCQVSFEVGFFRFSDEVGAKQREEQTLVPWQRGSTAPELGRGVGNSIREEKEKTGHVRDSPRRKRITEIVSRVGYAGF